MLNLIGKDLYLYFNDDFDKEELLNNLIQRRLKNEPISKIINKKSFWDYDFYVNENVLDPRPDTENLIELVLDIYNTQDKLTISVIPSHLPKDTISGEKIILQNKRGNKRFLLFAKLISFFNSCSFTR